jgi:hypothetical protein
LIHQITGINYFERHGAKRTLQCVRSLISKHVSLINHLVNRTSQKNLKQIFLYDVPKEREIRMKQQPTKTANTQNKSKIINLCQKMNFALTAKVRFRQRLTTQ